MKDCVSPAKSAYELIKFVSDRTGLSRYNLTNHSHHEKNDEIAKQIFGFRTFNETINHINAFYQRVSIEHPKSCFEDKKLSSNLRT